MAGDGGGGRGVHGHVRGGVTCQYFAMIGEKRRLKRANPSTTFFQTSAPIGA